jgi:hypothetical protein
MERLGDRAKFQRMYPSYEVWLKEVDVHLLKLCGCTNDGLPDYGTRDAYDDLVEPLSCARDIIDAAKEY